MEDDTEDSTAGDNRAIGNIQQSEAIKHQLRRKHQQAETMGAEQLQLIEKLLCERSALKKELDALSNERAVSSQAALQKKRPRIAASRGAHFLQFRA